MSCLYRRKVTRVSLFMLMKKIYMQHAHNIKVDHSALKNIHPKSTNTTKTIHIIHYNTVAVHYNTALIHASSLNFACCSFQGESKLLTFLRKYTQSENIARFKNFCYWMHFNKSSVHSFEQNSKHFSAATIFLNHSMALQIGHC